MKNGINKITVIGDSILKGAITGTNSGHLFDIIDENSLSIACKNLNIELNNQSVFGNIITKGQRRLSKEIEKGTIGDLAIIESGGNDCDYDWGTVCLSPTEEHLPRVPISDFISTLDEMITVCLSNKITPLVMTMPPLVGDRWFNHICNGYDKEAVKTFVKNIPDVLYRNHEIYNMHIVKYCYSKNIQFVDMRLAFLESKNYRDLMCLDGIHPNPEGYKFMASVWEKELPNIKKEF